VALGSSTLAEMSPIISATPFSVAPQQFRGVANTLYKDMSVQPFTVTKYVLLETHHPKGIFGDTLHGFGDE